MFYLYILFSVSANKYYVGYSDDPTRRLFEHNHGNRTTYTSKYRPWELKKQIELCDNRSFAMRIEKAVKKLKSRVIIEKIIAKVDNVKELAQLVSVPIHRD